jgi:nitrite reductase/ring-hydroxylating ferredoxin subunit
MMISRDPSALADPDRPVVPPDRGSPESQPKWRRDFPIDSQQDEYVSRRELVKFMVLTSGAFVAGQLWLLAKSLFERPGTAPPALAVASIEELPIGGAKTFQYPLGSSPRLLIRTGSTSFVAYDQQCTHLSCPVVPVFAQGRLHGPCHKGWFDLATGRPVAGPPQRPLPRVTLEVRSGTVYATGVEEGPS